MPGSMDRRTIIGVWFGVLAAVAGAGALSGGPITLGTGALWAFTRDMQIDLGTYVGVHGDEPVATPFLGFSIRR